MYCVEDQWLVVDLDGTLLRSDMLYECFWSALSRDWKVSFRIPWEWMHGKPALKQYLANASNINVALLPYDEEVLSYIRRWKSQYGKVALVTATHQSIATSIASHLTLFDETHGSKGSLNLKGKAKGEFLVDRFGERKFAYIGDSYADLPVWGKASKAITVNAKNNLRRKVGGACTNTEHLSTSKHSVRDFLRAMRPHQWLKNVLVFLPMLAAHNLESLTLLLALLAFICFSLVASGIYILNDLMDLSADRQHSRKCYRPLASGDLPIAWGSVLPAILVGLGCLLSLAISHGFTLLILGYLLLTTAYSLILKRKPIIDICSLAALYTLRILAGAEATNIQLSVWMLSFSVFFFLSLAAVKRLAELVDAKESGKLQIGGRGYYVSDLPIVSNIAVAGGYLSILVMILYFSSSEVRVLYKYPEFLWGVGLVMLYWVSKVILLGQRGEMHHDPVVYAATDQESIICAIVVLFLLCAGTGV